MKYIDKKIFLVSFTLSVLLHAALFTQLPQATLNNSHAPEVVSNKQIYIHLVKPAINTKKEKTEPNKIKRKMERKKTLKKKQSISKNNNDQVSTQKSDRTVNRQQVAETARVQQEYLTRLLIHIERHKFYPHAARARGIEGSIQVSFHLQANGSISGLYTKGDSMRLRRAAKRAVTNALPLPTCPAEVVCPMQVNYAMQFKLR